MNPLALEIRHSLTSPKQLCDGLGLKISENRGEYCLVLCPVHNERTASCSVHKRNRTIAVKCWGCEWTGDALSLIAAVRGLNLGRDFREVMREAASIAGRSDLLAQLEDGAKRTEKVRVVPRPEPPPELENPYPDPAEVAALWAAAGPVRHDPVTSATLAGRDFDPDMIDAWGLAKALVLRTGLWCPLPEWAWCSGNWWPAHGYRMIVPVFDADGTMRAVRAWLTDPSKPNKAKRRPPSRRKHGGLAMANPEAVAMLKGEPRSSRVVIVEGEPDYMARSLVNPGLPVIGVLSGSWHEGFAARIPYGAEVLVRTHLDHAGDGYANAITETLRGRARVYRRTIEAAREDEAA